MRIKLVIALAAVLCLAIAGVALAAQVQTADIKFSKSKAGGGTAIATHFTVSDPDNHTAGQEGKPTRQIGSVDIAFPNGTKFNYQYLPICKEVTAQRITANCAKAKLASGSTVIDGRGGALGGRINGTLTAYNAKKGLQIVVSAPGTVANNQTLSPQLSGSHLITDLPAALATPGIDAFLADFQLNIPLKYGTKTVTKTKTKIVHKRRHGKRVRVKVKVKVKSKVKVPYAQLPKTCPAGGNFLIQTKYNFLDGGTFTTPGTSNPCTK